MTFKDLFSSAIHSILCFAGIVTDLLGLTDLPIYSQYVSVISLFKSFSSFVFVVELNVKQDLVYTMDYTIKLVKPKIK